METSEKSAIFVLMGEHKQIKQVESKIIVLRDTQVILDRDIADLYGVETRDINKAVKNNPDKFPQGYIITLEKETGGKFPPVQSAETFNSSPESLYRERALYARHHHQVAPRN